MEMEGSELRWCRRCKDWLPLTEFYNMGKTRKFEHVCKKCARGLHFSNVRQRNGCRLRGWELEVARARFWTRNMVMSTAPLVPLLVRDLERVRMSTERRLLKRAA